MVGGNTNPRLIAAVDEDDNELAVVLKLKDPGVPIGESHYEGTSLACELMCSILARALGFNVPDYAVVELSPQFAESVHEAEVRELCRKNIGNNFGSCYLP